MATKGPSKAQINAQKNAAKKQERLMQAQLRQSQAATKAALKGMAFEMPKMPTLEPAPPPATQTSADIMAASEDARRQASMRYGLGKTRVAGETGGWLGGASTPMGGGNPIFG